ncbi:c-type heme family protein [Gloeobacter kilaueensis]|uniref:Cellulose synthase subunit BcsC n=1 Tax=Gloeobacter kilaueensis (strain ATCC BAA-2537 / CCAP 1431/1 / ULC 316 / JS1) TaxID=1183438 RepID=U5QNB0_GLOK1|nr:DUF3365 domain-containing protein [Gloeobacter kilaueensis]AGY60406.1 cellulose synthase subunit BcsC [Gloeobacter kilaueensis JS1]
MIKAIGLPSITSKFRRTLIPLVLVTGFAGTLFSYFLLQKNADQEVEQKAELLLDTLQATRSYVKDSLRPAVDPLVAGGNFIPQAQSATFVARSIWRSIERKRPDSFIFKEATPNPLNVADEADSFETTLVQRFASDAKLEQIRTYRDTPEGRFFVLAKPIRTDASCLACHGDPLKAPAVIQQIYGRTHGYGWPANQVVSAFVVQVPASAALRTAATQALAFAAVIAGMLVVLAFALNRLLDRYVLKPVKNLTEVAEQVSLGRSESEIVPADNAEIRSLGDSLTRLKRSVTRTAGLLQSAYFEQGEALIKEGKSVEAGQAFSRALAVTPNSAKTRLALGRTLAATGDRTAAIAQYRTALELQPDNPELHLELALALQGEGDFEASREPLGRARELFQQTGQNAAAEQVENLLKSRSY